MGEAKKRRASQADWFNTLDDSEKIIASTALASFERIITDLSMTGGCYRISFFMTEYLLDRHGINVEPVIGFINDGTDDLCMSHAWVEYRGQKTDLTLVYTEMQPPGPLLVLNREIIKGKVKYSYRLEDTQVSRRLKLELAQDPRYRESVAQKDEEHAFMLETAPSSAKRRSYLDSAPDGYDFEALSHLIT